MNEKMKQDVHVVAYGQADDCNQQPFSVIVAIVY
jgi:hypothetical protein